MGNIPIQRDTGQTEFHHVVSSLSGDHSSLDDGRLVSLVHCISICMHSLEVLRDVIICSIL